jgi:hypothetical protein
MSLSIFYRAPEKDQGPKIKDWSSGVNALSRQIHVKIFQMMQQTYF